MKLSACIEWLFSDETDDFAQRIHLAKKAGLDAVEFWFWSNKDIDAIEAALRETGLSLSGFVAEPMIALTDAANREKFLSGLDDSIATARRLGAKVLIAQAGNDLPGVSREDQHRAVVETLKGAADKLAGTGVRLGVEPLNTLIDHQGYYLSSTRVALNIVGLLVKDRFYADYGIDYQTQQCLEGFGALDLPQEIVGYKPRPLEGVWATPPYLHNGSVPSLYQMLVPPHERDPKFFVGRREFDPVHVGYVTKPADEDDDDGFWLDTSIEGNRNIGHGFVAEAETWRQHREDPHANPLPRGVIGPELTDDERWALVEYLKVHRDLPETPADYTPPTCELWGRTL